MRDKRERVDRNMVFDVVDGLFETEQFGLLALMRREVQRIKTKLNFSGNFTSFDAGLGRHSGLSSIMHYLYFPSSNEPTV